MRQRKKASRGDSRTQSPQGGGENAKGGRWTGLKKCLSPGWPLTVLLVILSGLGLFAVFCRGFQDSPLAYAAYVLSFYTLVVCVIRAAAGVQAARRTLHTIPTAHRYLTDAYFRVRTGLTVSFLVNLLYAGLRMVYAVRYASFWDGALMAYYLLLCAVRLYLIGRVPAGEAESDYRQELAYYRTTGRFLLVLSLVLMGVATQIVRDGQGYSYQGTLIYAVALHAFYSLTLAVVNVVRYRRLNSPVLSAAKAVGLTTAVVSVFSLETAMLEQFGEDGPFKTRMLTTTAFAVCVFAFAQSIYMLLFSKRAARRLAGLSTQSDKEGRKP